MATSSLRVPSSGIKAKNSKPEPLAIVDVHYVSGSATAACVVARHWTASVADETHTTCITTVLPYTPGRFFERELPCIVQVLSLVKTTLAAIVVDGYVQLDDRGMPGLGAHLYDYYNGRYAVIGVAKTPYRGSAFAAEVFRGSSKRPVFVTAKGIVLDDSARLVASMHGAHRVPTLLRMADQLARSVS